MVTASDIVEAARSVIGSSYRYWYGGATIPMWRDDGYYFAPPAGYILSAGVMCSDLLNFARETCGLPSVGGTEAWEWFITDWQAFDPSTPGIPGAVAVNGYTSESQQGHVILYTGEHSCVQALLSPGVTEDYTDAETYSWGGWCDFKWYGFMPDVDYSGVLPERPTQTETWVPAQAWYEENSGELSFWIGDRKVS